MKGIKFSMRKSTTVTQSRAVLVSTGTILLHENHACAAVMGITSIKLWIFSTSS